MPVILNGSSLAKSSLEDMKTRVAQCQEAMGRPPCLVTVQVGDDPSSTTYVNMKGKMAERLGMQSQSVRLPESTTTSQLVDKLNALNADSAVTGILLQHPCGPNVDTRTAFDSIDRHKDVDGVHSANFGRVALGDPSAPHCCTPRAIMRLLEHYHIDVKGMSTLVVGRSPILGRPVSTMLTNADATVTLAHSRSKDLPRLVAQNQLIVGAAGRPRLIKAEWVEHPQAILVDAGYHAQEKCGDIELSQQLIDRCHAYTPVPGGVGPMTINTLMLQTIEAAEQKIPQSP